MPQHKKSVRFMYKDVLVAFHEHGLEHVKEMHAERKIRRNHLQALIAYMQEHRSPEKELLAWAQEAVQRRRGRDAPAIGETRPYEPTFRGKAGVPILRTPLHHMKATRKKPLMVTFNKDEIIIRRPA